MTGPLLTTWEPDVYKGLNNDEPFYFMKTEEEAIKYVLTKSYLISRTLLRLWYIALGNADSSARLSSHLVKAVIEEAHKNKLKVAVHATRVE